MTMLLETLPKPLAAVQVYVPHIVEVSRGMVSVPVMLFTRIAPAAGTGWPLIVQVTVGRGTPEDIHNILRQRQEREKRRINAQHSLSMCTDHH